MSLFVDGKQLDRLMSIVSACNDREQAVNSVVSYYPTGAEYSYVRVPFTVPFGAIPLSYISSLQVGILNLFGNSNGYARFCDADKVRSVLQTLSRVEPCSSDYEIWSQDPKRRVDTRYWPSVHENVYDGGADVESYTVKYPFTTSPRVSFYPSAFGVDLGDLRVIPPDVLSVDGGGEGVIDDILGSFEDMLSKAKHVLLANVPKSVVDVDSRWVRDDRSHCERIDFLDREDTSMTKVPSWSFQSAVKRRDYSEPGWLPDEIEGGCRPTLNPLLYYFSDFKRVSGSLLNLFDYDFSWHPSAENDDYYLGSERSVNYYSTTDQCNAMFNPRSGLQGFWLREETRDMYLVRRDFWYDESWRQHFREEVVKSHLDCVSRLALYDYSTYTSYRDGLERSGMRLMFSRYNADVEPISISHGDDHMLYIKDPDSASVPSTGRMTPSAEPVYEGSDSIKVTFTGGKKMFVRFRHVKPSKVSLSAGLNAVRYITHVDLPVEGVTGNAVDVSFENYGKDNSRYEDEDMEGTSYGSISRPTDDWYIIGCDVVGAIFTFKFDNKK